MYDFDYSSILEAERHQMIRVRNCISKHQTHLEWERDVKCIDLALKLLDIVEEDGCSEMTPTRGWVLNKYVNIRNSSRFSKTPFDFYSDSRTGALYRDGLRIQKAWYLYHKVKLYHLREWWD